MEVGLLHHLGFNTEAGSLCETPRCLWAWGSPVCALQLGAAARFAVSPRLHARVDRGKAGGAPRGAAGNSFLPPQNREEPLIPSTGEVCGHVFYDHGAAAVPAACRQRLPQAGGVALCQGLFKELLGGRKPCGLGCRQWHGHGWMLLSQILSGPTLPVQGQPQPRGRALVPCQKFLSWL